MANFRKRSRSLSSTIFFFRNSVVFSRTHQVADSSCVVLVTIYGELSKEKQVTFYSKIYYFTFFRNSVVTSSTRQVAILFFSSTRQVAVFPRVWLQFFTSSNRNEILFSNEIYTRFSDFLDNLQALIKKYISQQQKVSYNNVK